MKPSTLFAFLLLAAGTSPGQSEYCLGHDFVATTGAPYSAEETYEQVQTRAGRTYTARRTCKLFRDAQGRERIEALVPTYPTGAPDAPTEELVIEIRDPVSGFRFTLGTETKLAHRYSMADSFKWLKARPQPGAKTVTESLGTRLMEGVSAEGQLETTTVPKLDQGKRVNLRTSVETWRSPELQVVLLSKSILGETRITKLSRSEPSPDLFRLPPGYTLVEFSIPSGAPRPSTVGPGPSTNPMPVAISQPKPEYTPAARAAGIQGPVTLTLTIGPDGVPRDIRVVRRLGLDPGLDQKAIEAVGKWRFRPGQKDGQPAAVSAITEVNFKL